MVGLIAPSGDVSVRSNFTVSKELALGSESQPVVLYGG